MTYWGLGFASVASVLIWSRTGFSHGFVHPKMLSLAVGIMAAWYWLTPAAWKKMNSSAFLGPVLLFGVCMIPALLGSQDTWMSILGHPRRYSGGLLTFFLCASGLLLADSLPDGKGRENIKKAILCSGAIMALLCVAQMAGRDPFRFVAAHGRAGGLLGSPIEAGALFVVLWTFHKNPLYLAGLLATWSYGAWIGAAIALVPNGRYRVSAFVLATVVGVSWTFTSFSLSNQGRVTTWKAAVSGFMAHPLKGTGPATFRLSFNKYKAAHMDEPIFRGSPGYFQIFAHNAVLEALVTKGLVGLVGLLAFLVAPELAGLWFICMFNPISFQVTFVACIMVGLYRRREDELCRIEKQF